MSIRPKQFVAARRFSCAGDRFEAGDIVPPSVALSTALRFGDRFVIPARRRATFVPAATDESPDPIQTPDDDPVDGSAEEA